MKCPNCGRQLPLSLLAQGMGQVGGSQTSAAKKRSSRANGQKGGRPRKQQGKP